MSARRVNGSADAGPASRFRKQATEWLADASDGQRGEVREKLESLGIELGLPTSAIDQIIAKATPKGARRVRPPEAPAAQARTLCMADVRPGRVEWLWPGYVPRGALTLLDGDPKVGKSTLAIDLAARVTTGKPMPDGSVSGAKAGSVILLSAEDHLANTVSPRLVAAGANPRLVHAFLDIDVVEDGEVVGVRAPSLPDDVDQVGRAVRRWGASLVIIDVLSAYLGSRVDSHRDQDVRRALMPLARMAEETGAAVVATRHLTKNGGSDPLYRGGGSIGIAGQARSLLLAARHPVDPSGERRVLASTACNLGPQAPSLEYRIVPAARPAGATCVDWRGRSDYGARRLLAAPDETDDRPEREAVQEVIRETLSRGPATYDQVKAAVTDAGLHVSDKTIQRARRALGITPRRSDGPQSVFVLELPPAHHPDRGRPEHAELSRCPQ